jgi:Ca-activated chloride channel family protein
MAFALEATIKVSVPAGRGADILLITDGQIWDIDGLLQRIGDSAHRLFVIAVGASPSEELARKVSGLTRGACEFVAPGEDMRAAVGRLSARMGAPALTVGNVDWPGVPAWTLGAGQTAFPGDTMHVLAGFAARPVGSAVVTVVAGTTNLTQSCVLPESCSTEDALSRIAAMRRLASMEREAAAALAERYQLVTTYTSCVVVMERSGEEKAQGDPALRAVPQMLAAGWGGTSRVVSTPRQLREAHDHWLNMPALMSAPSAPVQDKVANSAPVSSGRFYQSAREDEESMLRRKKPAASPFAAALAKRLSRAGALPETIEELRSLGLEQVIIDKLREVVAEGNRELDVVTAWLAIFSWSRDGVSLGSRTKARLARAADRALRDRVSRALASVGAVRHA